MSSHDKDATLLHNSQIEFLRAANDFESNHHPLILKRQVANLKAAIAKLYAAIQSKGGAK